jgi:ABC-type uncharacterized transport system involved in gliding motility auxiliary subunit
MRSNAAIRTAAAIGLAGVLFVSSNELAYRLLGGSGIDLTDSRLYTVSPATLHALRDIPEPITLKFYYSSRLGQIIPSYGIYAQRVRHMLETYADLAHGRIKLQVLDPAPFSELEDQATAAGLQGAPAGQGETVYFGLVGVNSTDDTETIPFFQRDKEASLEYDLTKLVQKLAHPKKRVVGLLSTLQLDADPMAQMRGRQSQPQAVLDELRQVYEVRDLQIGIDTIPDDVDVLMIAQPQKLAPKTEYAIDQFVMNGGHVLVFADPYSEFSVAHHNPMLPHGGDSAAEFDTLFKSWGVTELKGKLVADRLAANKVTFGANDEPVDYVLWMTLRGDDILPNDPVTAKLTEVNVASAGALEPVKGAKTTFKPLLRSSDDSELVNAKTVMATPVPDATALLQDFKPTGTRYTLAARVTGPASTAFPGGPPKDANTKKAQIKTAKSPIDVIVVADTDLLDDRFWIQFQDFIGRRVGEAFSGNGDFVQNAVDTLAGTNDLINLRSHGSAVRPFTLVDKIRRDADTKYEAQEKDLQTKLKDTQKKLASIKAPDDSSGAVELTPDQAKAVEQFQNEIVQTRGELRRVQLALRENIDRLKNRLVIEDVALVPALVAGAAVLLGMLRLRRRRQHKPAN